MKKHYEIFLYGKIRNKRYAKFYCKLHKCYISKQNLFEKKFKCEKCKYKEEVK